MSRVWWSSSSGRIELHIDPDDAASGSHQGPCDDDIADLRRVPYIAEQLDKIPAPLLSEELREYGAWDDARRASHEKNLDRLLWLACGDIVDGNCDAEDS